ncbi:MAG TPA: PAS domain-containing protein [Rhizomicrobium sp.]|jgi:hypothetical protein|nr:PAS domain-containing protein [Rhizomicrobium sp.]
MDTHIGSAAEYNRAATQGNWHSYCDDKAGFSHPDLRQLFAIWQGAAGEDAIPLRSAMTPRLLKPFLRDIAIYERVGDGQSRRYRIRLMGTAFAQIVGDLTGRFIDESVPMEIAPRWHGALDATLGARKVLRFLGREDTRQMTFLTGEFFSAPLRSDDGTVNQVLGAAHYSGKRPWEEVERELRNRLGA